MKNKPEKALYTMKGANKPNMYYQGSFPSKENEI